MPLSGAMLDQLTMLILIHLWLNMSPERYKGIINALIRKNEGGNRRLFLFCCGNFENIENVEHFAPGRLPGEPGEGEGRKF